MITYVIRPTMMAEMMTWLTVMHTRCNLVLNEGGHRIGTREMLRRAVWCDGPPVFSLGMGYEFVHRLFKPPR